ncbi:MAG: hypothetical protein JWM90_2404 [Thermoleophilia bacterium]|nr:hypothetical protein [Thermoleophilia bacterium]
MTRDGPASVAIAATAGVTAASPLTWAVERLPDPALPERAAPVATKGVGHDRALLDGLTLDRPLEIVPNFLTNLVERITGERDERSGKAMTQVLLAGQQLLQAGLRHVASGKGIIAAGSNVLGKVLPVLSIASGVAQVWQGWNELDSHEDGLFSIIHSRTGRTGVLQVIAGALLFIPGVGPALAGAATRFVSAANELDAFKALDWKSTPLEQQGAERARRIHWFDETPTVAYDRTPRA